MDVTKADTALVAIDPQYDVLSETGVSWPLVGDSVRENNTVENLNRLVQTAKRPGYGVFVSPTTCTRTTRTGGSAGRPSGEYWPTRCPSGRARCPRRGRVRLARPVQAVR